MTPERLDRLRVRYKHVKRELARKAWLDDGSFASLSHLLGGEALAPMYGFNCAGKIVQTGWWPPYE